MKNYLSIVLQVFAGACGGLLFGVGVVGAGITSIYVDRTKKFEEVAKVAFALSSLFLIGFVLVSIENQSYLFRANCKGTLRWSPF